MKRLTKLFAGLFFLLVTVNCSHGQIFPGKAMWAMQGNEVRYDKTKPNGNFYAYPVMFDGQILDYADFTMKTRGQLFVVKKNPGTANATVVAFYIYLSRNGKIVKEGKMNSLSQPVDTIEISDILSFSKAGDVLIVVPATKSGGKTTIIWKEMC